jgi:DNA mismatch repair protein MutS
MKGFGIDELPAAQIAASVILNYLEETQRGKLHYIQRVTKFETAEFVSLDPQTKRNLEITFSMQDGSRDGTLIGVLDKTQTAMGARVFKKWISRPLRNIDLIQTRLDATEELFKYRPFRETLRALLKQCCDIERALSRIATQRANPKEVLALASTLGLLPSFHETLAQANAPLLKNLRGRLNLCENLFKHISNALSPEAPVSISDGGVIKTGYNAELDDYRSISTGAKDKLLEIQEEERKKTGIASLKVLYNKVFGYYIEISNANKTKVPEHYERKQTMVNAERYMIPVLKEYEQKILTAEEKTLELEQRLFQELRQTIAQDAETLLGNADVLASLDCLASFAEAADVFGYTKPAVSESDKLFIRNGKHPVLETLMPPDQKYIPNDTALDDEIRVMMITGPNMSGKSSYLRQTGLITLLAQIGSFVPAEAAEIGIVDKIFTRVGASDNLAAGESTFLVEMNEAANILNNATHKSLILLDEIGRGTSTYDGMSIAWAMTEYIHDRVGAKTLFATHYHELSELESQLARVKNFNATVAETADKVIFLRKIVRGAADNSYGIEVAKMAGLPDEVITRAREILSNLEGDEKQRREKGEGVKDKVKAIKPKDTGLQISMFEIGDAKLKDALTKIDVNKMTPVEALLKLAELKRIADSGA